MYQTCPKCGHQRQPEDTGPTGQCPACGIYFEKWLKSRFAGARPATVEVAQESAASNTRVQALLALLFNPGQPTETLIIAARAVLLLVFALWGLHFIGMDIDSNQIGQSFMHRVNLIFHEAGHILFMPLGWFMTVLGGSLMQLIMPLIVILAFLLKNRDPYSASFGLWWLGQSLMDLAPYIADASALKLVLLGGVTGMDRPGYHDWNNILLELGLIDQDQQIAAAADLTGSLVMMTGIAWGAAILVLQYQQRSR